MPILDQKNSWERLEIEAFLQTHPNGWFTQSPQWPSVKQDCAAEIVYTRAESGAVNAAAVVLFRHVPLLRRPFLYAPRGPVVSWEDKGAVNQILDEIGRAACLRKAYKILIDPFIMADDVDLIQFLQGRGYRLEQASEEDGRQSGYAYILPLAGKSVEEIFQSFHSKWRYNIRLAAKKNVVCKVCGAEGVEDFYPLWAETGKRDGFPIRGKAYLINLMETLGEHCRLYLCYLDGEPLSGALAIQYAGKTSYVFGASSEQHREAMPNYLVQMEMIRWAVESGCSLYDFGGLPGYHPDGESQGGIYRFKRGFGGKAVRYSVGFSNVKAPALDCFVRGGGWLRGKLQDLRMRSRG